MLQNPPIMRVSVALLSVAQPVIRPCPPRLQGLGPSKKLRIRWRIEEVGGKSERV
jgi:hypothetical protein